MGGLCLSQQHQSDQEDLFTAAGYDLHTWVDDLVKAGANVNTCNKYGYTPLTKAILDNSFKFVEAIIKAGADVNMIDKRGRTALLDAAIFEDNYDLRIPEILIKAGADVNASDKDGYTVLLLAVHFRKHKLAKLLLKSGADVNASTKLNRSGLVITAYRNSTECVKVLLKSGARVNIIDKDENNALNYFRSTDNESDATGEFRTILDRILFAAGELPNDRILKSKNWIQCENNLCLMVLCRSRIRNHLLRLDKHMNLFVRIPQLGLPTSLTEYLLYNVCLGEELDLELHNA